MSESFWQTLVTSLIGGIVAMALPIGVILAKARVNRKQLDAQDKKLERMATKEAVEQVHQVVNSSAAELAAKNEREMQRLHEKIEAVEAQLARANEGLANKG